jgi:hypothetical protein
VFNDFVGHKMERPMLEANDILTDAGLSREQKIARLKELLSEARGLQRAATEGGMDPDDGVTRNLRDIELALDQLNAEQPEAGAATL